MLIRGQAAAGGNTTTVHDLLIAKEELTKEEDMLRIMIRNVEEDLKSI